MLAVIEKVQTGYKVKLELQLKNPVNEVWAWLTENEKLKQWFLELRIDSLQEGGKILFDMSNDTFEEMEILKLIHESLLEFTWGDDTVRFELHKDKEGCKLIFIESLKEITSHTPKDIAGWHVCLKLIQSLLKGKLLDAREKEWEKLYKAYTETFNEIKE